MIVNSREKGKKGEREFAKLCRGEGFPVRRGQQYNGLEGKDVVGLDGFHVEVKRCERINIYEFMSQAVGDAEPGEIPIVAMRKNHEAWLVLIGAEDFLKLLTRLKD